MPTRSSHKGYRKERGKETVEGGRGIRKRGLSANKHDRIVIAVRAILNGGLLETLKLELERGRHETGQRRGRKGNHERGRVEREAGRYLYVR